MTTRKRVIVSLTGLVLIVGMAGGVGFAGGESKRREIKVSDETEAEPMAGSLRSKIYFSEPEHLYQVGYCVTSTCPNLPKGTTCEGTTTPYYEIYVDSCTGAP